MGNRGLLGALFLSSFVYLGCQSENENEAQNSGLADATADGKTADTRPDAGPEADAVVDGSSVSDAAANTTTPDSALADQSMVDASLDAVVTDAKVADQSTIDVSPNVDASTTDTSSSGITFTTEWVRHFGGSEHDYVRDIALDDAANVLMIGSFGDSVDFGGGPQSTISVGYDDIFYASYASDGTYRFGERYGGTGSDEGRSVVVDSNGNTFLCGQFYGTADFGDGPLTAAIGSNIFIASYSPTGQCRWSKKIDGWSNTRCHGLAVDSSGNLYVTGQFSSHAQTSTAPDFGAGPVTSNGDTDIFVASYTTDGGYRWAKAFGGANFDAGEGIAVSDKGTVYVTGSFRETTDFGTDVFSADSGYDIFVLSFAANGQQNWAKGFGGGFYDTGQSVAVDAADNVYVTGIFEGTIDFGDGPATTAGDEDIFILSYASDGSHRWSRTFGDSQYDAGLSIAVDGNAEVIATGTFRGTVNFGNGPLNGPGGDTFLAVFSADGAPLGSTSFDAGSVPTVAVDANDNIYLAGGYTVAVDFGTGLINNSGGNDVYLVKLTR